MIFSRWYMERTARLDALGGVASLAGGRKRAEMTGEAGTAFRLQRLPPAAPAPVAAAAAARSVGARADGAAS